MRTFLLLQFLLLPLCFFAQKNYTIKYDKLKDNTSYYQDLWVNGKVISSLVKSIRLEQNDIVTVEILNVNKFVFQPVVSMTEIKKEDNESSPLPVILSAFTGFGGPALKMLTSLASNAPPEIGGSRGSATELDQLKSNINSSIAEMHKSLTYLNKAYRNYAENKMIIYDKTLTKDEIVNKLSELLEKEDNTLFEVNFNALKKAHKQLQDLKLNESLPADDPIWADIYTIESINEGFTLNYLDDEGNFKNYSIKKDLIEAETTEFFEKHTFLAKAYDKYDSYISNEFIILFEEKSTKNTGSTFVDFIKIISVPIKQAALPKWSLGVDVTFPFGGNDLYEVNEIEGDYYGIPDSLRIGPGASRNALLTLGTKLSFDIPTDKSLLPSVFIGAGLSGTDVSKNEWSLSLLMGGGIRLKKFPYFSLNTGLCFTQLKVLKSEFDVNKTFLKPQDADSNNDFLYQKKFKPGIFVGIGFLF
jgi:hypothetical protein